MVIVFVFSLTLSPLSLSQRYLLWREDNFHAFGIPNYAHIIWIHYFGWINLLFAFDVVAVCMVWCTMPMLKIRLFHESSVIVRVSSTWQHLRVSSLCIVSTVIANELFNMQQSRWAHNHLIFGVEQKIDPNFVVSLDIHLLSWYRSPKKNRPIDKYTS